MPMSFSGKDFQLAKWEFMSPVSQSDVIISPTPSAGVHLKFSKFVLNIPVRRLSGYYFYNVFGTAFMLTSLQAAGFALPRESLEGRLAIMMTLVLTQLAFKFAIMDRLPSIPYLSIMDKYLMFVMFLSLTVAVEHVAVVNWLDEETAIIVDFYCPYCLLGLMLIANIIILFCYKCSGGSNPTGFKDKDIVHTWLLLGNVP